MHKKRKTSRGLRKLPQVHEKVCDEMKQRKKRRARKNVIEGRKPFIMPIQNTSENDLHEVWGNNYGYNIKVLFV